MVEAGKLPTIGLTALLASHLALRQGFHSGVRIGRAPAEPVAIAFVVKVHVGKGGGKQLKEGRKRRGVGFLP
jgi:hypothetical protein